MGRKGGVPKLVTIRNGCRYCEKPLYQRRRRGAAKPGGRGHGIPTARCTPPPPCRVGQRFGGEGGGFGDFDPCRGSVRAQFQGRRGIASVVRWNLRPVIFGVDFTIEDKIITYRFFFEGIIFGNCYRKLYSMIFLGELMIVM